MTWPALLGPLTRREPVPVELVSWGMREIMSDAATSAQIAAFGVAMRMHGETAGEIAALVDVMLEFARPIDIPGFAIDPVGTGGDGAHTVNISTMAAVLLAAAGTPVVKHGNRAASSKCGSADVLEALGVKLELEPAAASAVFDELGLTFLYAPAYHPALRFAGPARREIGVPTVFNLLGPLANPARPKVQLLGVADATRAQLMIDTLRLRGTTAIAVHGEDGLDEVSVFAPTIMWPTWLAEPIVFDPFRHGLARFAPDALRGGDPAFNADVATRVLSGRHDASLAGVITAVLLNAATAQVAFDAALGAVPDDVALAVMDKLPALRAVLEAGEPQALLDRWIALTNH